MVAPIEPSLLPSPTPLTPAKRPITSSAFSFTFSTPAPTRPRPLGTLASQSSFSPFGDDRKPPIPVRNATTKKIYTTLDVLPLPYSLDGTPQAGPSKPTHRLSDLLDEVSPFRPGNKPRGDGGDEKAMVRLGEIPGRRMTEDLGRRVKGVVEDEGLGVSPRRSRTGVRWTGKGPSPPSLQLASLLSSAHSSLLLFYTSLHQTLHPSRSTTAPPSVSRHTRTAPIQMVLKRAVAGPAHQAMMFWCEVLQWRAHSTIITRLLPPDNGDGDSAMDGEGHEEKGDEVLMVFQPVPNECPRLGVDPRVAKGKLDEGKRWEVGVWGPWAEIELCVSPEAFKAGRTSGGDDEKEGDMDMDVDGGGGGKHDREEKKTKVLMVTRYLVAHAEL